MPLSPIRSVMSWTGSALLPASLSMTAGWSCALVASLPSGSLAGDDVVHADPDFMTRDGAVHAGPPAHSARIAVPRTGPMPARLKVTSAPRPFVRSPTGWAHRLPADRLRRQDGRPEPRPRAPLSRFDDGLPGHPDHREGRRRRHADGVGAEGRLRALRRRSGAPDSVTGHRQRLDQSADVGSEVTGVGQSTGVPRRPTGRRSRPRRRSRRRLPDRMTVDLPLAGSAKPLRRRPGVPLPFRPRVRVRASCVRVGRFRAAESAWLEPRVGGQPFSGDHIPAGRDMASERITWETCPRCGLTAAVGWLDGVPVEFDCTAGCAPTEQVLGRLRRPAGGPSSLARWADATRRWR